MYIIGLHRGHNAAVALLQNGSLVFAIQEERLTRVKNQGGLPRLGLSEIAGKIKAFEYNSSVRTNLALAVRAITNTVWQRDQVIKAYEGRSSYVVDQVRNVMRSIPGMAETRDRIRAAKIQNEVEALLRVPAAAMRRLDHHLCHASSAYFGWGKMDERILIVTCDGSGDGLCATVNIGYKGEIQRVAQVEQTHSIGELYAHATRILGMVPLEHEYKVMGLAPYADRSRESSAIAEELEAMFIADHRNPLGWKRNSCPPLQYASDFLRGVFKFRRFDHIASGVQLFLERFLVRWIKACICETGIRRVALSGGVFMNVKANQKILEIPELDELFVFPSCGDETNAIGAGWLLYYQLLRMHPPALGPLYLGDEFHNMQVESALMKYTFRHKVVSRQVADIEQEVAELLARGEIVARFRGRMEFGARALGNRSILANASTTRSVRVINEMIKSRDFWMPFAPSVLAERSEDYFIKPKAMSAPYMVITFDTKEEKRASMAAAVHPQDYTCRPQEVRCEWNPSYHRLLKCFESITGEGLVLNTSFNLHGEPIVYTPEDALRVFDVSGLRHLAIEEFMLTKV